MPTLIENIRRTVPKGKLIVENSLVKTQGLEDKLADLLKNNITSIVLDGYGSSKTAALEATTFIEKVAGIPVNMLTPNNKVRQIACDPHCLYVFISESGNSSLLEKDLGLVKDKASTLLVTANVNSKLAGLVDCVVDTGCADEDYFFHTVGHCCSALTLMMIGMRIGLIKNHISKAQYDEYCNDALAALNNHENCLQAALDWCKVYVPKISDARCLVFFGSGPLYGVAEEGAIKVQEITEKNITRSYEVYQRIYGSSSCFGKDDAVIVLDDDVNETITAKGIVAYMRSKFNNAYLIGPNTLADCDLKINTVGKDFRIFEYVVIMEIIAQELAIYQNHPILDKTVYNPDFFDDFMKEWNKQ